jgi:twitching motility protein PilT
MDRDKLHRLLKLGFEKGASDIHFQVGYLPLYRFNGELIELKYKVLTAEDTAAIAEMLMENDSKRFAEGFNEVDLAYEIPSEGRFRVNISRERRCYNIVLRVIPLQIRGFEELNLPRVVCDIANLRRGLGLVTGPTGMGKSTTLAAMINYINKTRKTKIVTVEDPVEFVFRHDRSIITQREIGTDTEGFATALRAALRQDPDVIMVGEMRDVETVDTALKAAETGHLVLSSIHTSDVAKTIGRLLSFFPPEEQQNVRLRLADNLMAVISLRLLLNKKETSRIPAVEVMRTTRTIQECVKDPKRTHEIAEFIAKGRSDHGMQTFDQHLLDLYRANKISLQTARAAATNVADFETQLTLEGEPSPAPTDDRESVMVLDDELSERF